VYRWIKDRLLLAPASRLLTAPIAFLVGGLIDLVSLAMASIRARAGRRRA
jgi:hypothetical protein